VTISLLSVTTTCDWWSRAKSRLCALAFRLRVNKTRSTYASLQLPFSLGSLLVDRSGSLSPTWTIWKSWNLSDIMFYSETLLSRTGPLARVWLSANLERKLSKTHILQSNIESSVSAIVDQGQAPMALRLSGQLLLGVVRIYSRKARYLLDDCNEALMKIKMVSQRCSFTSGIS
jgi:hypothetical protein